MTKVADRHALQALRNRIETNEHVLQIKKDRILRLEAEVDRLEMEGRALRADLAKY